MLLLFHISIDCSDGDDEANDCSLKKKQPDACSKLRCSPNGKCYILPEGPTCICPSGFQYNKNKQECEVNDLTR